MTTSTIRPRRGTHAALALATACSLGLAGFAGQAPAVAAPVAQPASPDGSALPQLPLQGPPQATSAQSWVLTLDPKGPSARAVEKAAANANAMSSPSRDVADHVDRTVARHGAKVLRAQANANGRVTVRLDRAVDASVAADLARSPQVLLAEPDITARPAVMTSMPNDTYFGLQWGLTGANGIHADAVWPTTTGDGQRVAVLDTGITDHPDLAGRTVAGYDFVSSTSAGRDGDGRDADSHDQGDWTTAGQCGTGSAASNSTWHGTHVASIVAATGNNGAGTTGVAPGAVVQPVRVLGACGGSSSDIADAITWASGGQVVGILRSTARATGDANLGSGIVDAKAAVAQASAQATASPSPLPSASPSPTATATPAPSASATPATATLTVPAQARRGTAVTVAVSGFTASEAVDVTFDGKRIAQLRTDATGTARTSWTVPSRTSTGSHAMAAKGLSSLRTAKATVQVS